MDFVPKIKIEMVMEKDVMPNAIKMIHDNKATGQISDGKIIILPVEDMIHIRNGKK